MKSRIKSKEECIKLFQIEIPRELVERTTKEVYQEIKKIAKIPGFRPGFAPQDLLEKHYSEDAKSEILKRLVPEGYKKAVETHRVVPIGMPRVFNINFERKKPLTFEAEVDIRPNIRLRNYKGIKVKKKRISVSQQETDEALFRLRNAYARYENVTRPIKKGDYAVCNVEAFVEGNLVTKKDNNMWILADREASLLGMGEELIGLTEGQVKELETKLPENYPDKKYAGKSAKFKVLVNEVKEKHLPAFDERFAESLNQGNTEQLKREIESQIFMHKENALKVDMENQILDRLLKDNTFQVPSSIVKRQREILAKRLEIELLQKGLNKDDVKKKLKELSLDLERDAANKVRIYFILDDIAAKENIEIKEKDIDEKIKSSAQAAGESEEEMKKYYEKNDLLGGLAEEIKEAKTLEFLLKQAQVVDEK